MTTEFKAFEEAISNLNLALVHEAPDQTIEKLYKELVAAHQIWWETTDEWKAINAQFHDQKE